MKVVILAAGKGSRLGDVDLPKPLTHLATGNSILERQVAILREYTSIENIIVIIGYHKEQVMECFPGLFFVYNPNYAAENTAKSLLRALNKLDDDVLWLNGDVVMHHSVIGSILAAPRTSMVVNVGPVGEEEVKYRQNAEGRILEVSKRVENPQGEALGINYCSRKDLDMLRSNLERCNDKDYFERGIELCIEQGLPVWSVPIEPNLCVEVDFPQDLAKANQLILEWSLS